MTYSAKRLNQRPKCFWGALVGGAMNLISSAISSKAQARAIQKQIDAQRDLAQTQLELQNQSNLASTLNGYANSTRSYNDEDKYGLTYRLGGRKRLGNKNIFITDGGDATKINNNTYLLRGGSHEDINETGQTGIGINVGGNEVEAEGGEVAQKKGNSLRIFSAQPILGGMSPAQAILRGYNKDKVFAEQQAFKKRNGLKDDGNKAKHGTEVPYKRIHINEDGTFTDTLNGKNYTTSATNGEDVVVTGKANHWKEAGKKNTSSYFNPMGAIDFGTAAFSPILNFTPSNIYGTIRDSNNLNEALKNYMTNDNGGFFTKEYAEKHPYISLAGNTLGDILIGNGINKGYDILTHPLNYGRNGYKLNKLYKKAGLLNRGDYKTVQENYDKRVDYILGNKPYDSQFYMLNDYPTEVVGKETNKNPEIFYSWQTPNKIEREAFKSAFDRNAPKYNGNNWGAEGKLTTKELEKEYYDLMNHNPEYYKFLEETNLPWDSQDTVDKFLKRQQTSIRGVYAKDKDVVKKYLTEIQAKRKGGDRLMTNGGLYTSNSNGIAQAFKNPQVGTDNGYVGTLNYDFGIDKSVPITDQLRQIRMKTFRGGRNNIFAGTSNYNKSIKSAREKGAVAIEDNYGRSNGDKLNVTERAYLPSSAKSSNLTITDLKEYPNQSNKAGRWNTSGVDFMPGDEKLFIPRQYNRFDDFIREARIFMAPKYGYDYNKESKFYNDIRDRTINRSIYRNKLINKSKRGKGNNPIDVTDMKYDVWGDTPFRFGGRIMYKLGGLTRKDRGLTSHPYPTVAAKDFAGGNRSYPIPTKADAVDALRLAGLHGREDVKSKVYAKYPELRHKALLGSDGNDYETDGGSLGTVNVTARRRKLPSFATLPTPNLEATAIPNFKTISIPNMTTGNTYVPYRGLPTNKSRTLFGTGDYIGLGIDTLSALGSGLITSNAYKNLDFNYNLPSFVEETPVSLNTEYHNEAQTDNVERNRINSRNSILRNSMSSSNALGRMQSVDTNALQQLNQLADFKENKETELRNQNLLNEQQVRARNAAAKNQYYNTVATIKNAALEAKNNASLARSQALGTTLSGLSQAWNNFYTAGRTAYEDDQARRAMIASSKDTTPTRFIETGYNLSPQMIAALYNTSTDQRTKDFYLSMLDDNQRKKYGIS